MPNFLKNRKLKYHIQQLQWLNNYVTNVPSTYLAPLQYLASRIFFFKWSLKLPSSWDQTILRHQTRLCGKVLLAETDISGISTTTLIITVLDIKVIRMIFLNKVLYPVLWSPGSHGDYNVPMSAFLQHSHCNVHQKFLQEIWRYIIFPV